MIPLFMPLFVLSTTAIALLIAGIAGYGVYKGASGEDPIGDGVRNILKGITGSGITDRDRESMALQDKYNKENSEIDYVRQRSLLSDFGPKWQLEQQAEAYDELGINRMMLTGASAGSAGASASTTASPSDPGSSTDGLATILGAVFKAKELKLQGDANDANIANINAKTDYQTIVNKYTEERMQLENDKLRADIDATAATIKSITANTRLTTIMEKYYPKLFESQAAEHNANAEAALARADESRSKVKLNEAEINELNAKVRKYAKEMEEIDARIMEIEQNCIYLSEQGHLSAALAEKAGKEMDAIEQQIKHDMLKMGFTEKEIQYYEWNHAQHQQHSIAGVKADNIYVPSVDEDGNYTHN